MKNRHRWLWLAILFLLPIQLYSQMQLVYNTHLIEKNTILLHLSDNVDVSIDWGDGNQQVVSNEGIIEHTYTEDGVYIVSLSGSLSWLGSETVNASNIALEGVLNFGDLGITSLKNAFKQAVNLQYVPKTLPHTVLNLSGCFSSLLQERIENLDQWDVSHVTDMSYLFYDSEFFNQDISNWDVSEVTNMEGVFARCLRFNQDIGNWDVAQVVNMNFLFFKANIFNHDLGSWNVGNVKTMHKIFAYAVKFNQNISLWDVSKVENMHGMFMGAHMFRSDVGGWDVSQVVDMDYMFFGATSINLDLSEWCVEKIPHEPFYFLVNNPYQEEDINLPFWGCSCNNMKLVYEINSNTGLSLGIHLSDTVDVRIDWGDGTIDHITTEGYHEHQYAEFGNKKVAIDGKLTHFGSESDKQFIGLKKVASFGDLKIRSLKNAFKRADSLLSVPQKLPSTIIDLNNCFHQIDRHTIANLEKWDVGNIENMHHMFYEASNFNQDIGEWSVGNVRRMDFMFYGAYRFNQDIGDWDVGYVQNMSNMFNGAHRFNQNISGWCVESFLYEPPQFSRNSLLEEYKPFWSTPCAAVKMVYNITNPSETTIGMRLTGNVDAIIDWGDTTIDTITNPGSINHTYTHTDTYKVSIQGQTSGFSTENPAFDESTLVHMSSFGNAGINSLQDAFQGANNLRSVPDTLPSSIQNISGCFSDLQQDSITNLDQWDVSHITDMSRLFYNSVNFNQDINGWDVSNVQDMSYMFYNAQHYNKALDQWNTSNARDMNHMFFNAEIFNQDIGSWDVGHVKNMSHMFSYAHMFDQDIGNWDVSQVNIMSAMFSNETVFNQDIGSWETGQVQNMHNMFYKAYLFNRDIGNWIVSQVTDMSGMFKEALSFNQDIGSWDVSSVNDMREMFYDASSFNQDLSEWCVSSFILPPLDFSQYSPLDSAYQPKWGEACVEGILLEDADTPSLIVYPNPVAGLLNIDTQLHKKGSYVVELYNNHGHLMERMHPHSFPLLIDCSKLAAGPYFLLMTDSKHSQHRSEIVIKK